MSIYHSVATADISEFTRPKSPGRVVDMRVMHQPPEPRPDYDKMRQVVHGNPGHQREPLAHEETGQEGTADRG